MAFNLPVQNFFSRVSEITPWVRPADWPVITDVPNEVQFLICDLDDASCSLRTTFNRTSGSQNLVIDWGDGNTDTLTAGSVTTVTNHQYVAGTGTPCSLGYTTFKIRVYFTGTGVSTITRCNIQPLYITGNTFSAQPVMALEAYYGDGTVTAGAPIFYGSPGASSSVGYFPYLKYVKFPTSVPSAWSSFSNVFNGCSSLARVKMPDSAPNLSSLSSAFDNCWELEEVTLPSDAINISNLQNTFSGCNNLRSVTFPPSLNSCTLMSSTFQGCINIRNITLPTLNNCSNFQSTFNGCTQLEWVKFEGLHTGTASINCSSMFVSCFNLQNVYFPTSVSSACSYSLSSSFNGCYNLKSIVFPASMTISSLSTTFGSCYSLASCILPTSTVGPSTMSAAFNTCISLKKITLPSSSISAINLSSAFSGCSKLEEVTIPSTLTISDMTSTFSNCVALKTLNWTPGVQDSLTTLVNTFNSCVNLTSVNLPTSMTGLTSLTAAFAQCRSLEQISFPSSLNSVTTMSNAFSNCSSLTSATLPTSMSACTDMSAVFAQCRSLISIVLPNIVSTSLTTFSGCFNGCVSLKSITFPGAAQLSVVTNISSLFASCSALTTIINFDKIGSLTATPLVNAGSNQYARLTNISFVAPFSLLVISGSTLTSGRTDVRSVRLLNTSAGQWTGTSPQINVSYTNMSTANLVQLFNDMAAQGNVVSKTISILNATGASGLTAADRLIITSKGWTITG